ncbi:MAG: signal peptide peptidase SppA [Anaerolineae bacterium]|nr:signal peptide peptidase SppA [Phycisphaerae bacterium]
MMPQPPPGQGPIDPRGAFSPPPGAGGAARPPMQPTMPPNIPPNMPPMMMMPPPGYYPPPPKRGGGFARGVLLTLATSIFGISILLNFYLLTAVGLAGGASSAAETVLVNGDAGETVAVIPLKGVITGESAERFEKLMREIEENGSIKALVLEIDTPGGEVTASDEIYRRVLKYKTDKGVKVVATMGSMATSGGYYIACATDYVYAQPTTLTGNIGVVMQRFNFSGLMEKWGVADTTITPEKSKYKYAESPFRPESPETAVYLRGLIDDTYGRFKDIVAKGRGTNLKATIDQVADGRVYTANDALKLGLIDEIGYADEAYTKAAAMAGLNKQHVVRYHRQPSLLDLLAGDTSANAGLGDRGATSSINGGGVNVKIDRSILDEITTPRLMSIYRGE